MIKSEQVTALHEVSKLTKLRKLKLTLESQLSLDDYHSCWGTVLQSLCNLLDLCTENLYDENCCLTLDSWHIAPPCSLRKLVIGLVLTKVPNWMGVLGNIGVLALHILCLAPEDIEILGAISSLLFSQTKYFRRHQWKDHHPWKQQIHKFEIFLLGYRCLWDCTGV